MRTTVEVPALEIDKVLYPDGHLGPRTVLERRIVAELIAHLDRAGFRVTSAWDGDTRTNLKDLKSAMEIVFNLDEVSLRFMAKNAPETPCKDDTRWRYSNEHGVLLVLGNGIDVISDWNYFADDRDGFDKAMEAFDAEAFA